MTSRSRSRSSKKSSGEPELPEVFVDRSLGSIEVPNGLRAVGFAVHTMSAVYGEARAQELDDVEWIPDAVELRWVIFSKDIGLTTDPERAKIIECSARVFLVPDTQARAATLIQRYVDNRFRIALRARKPGPYICSVRPRRLDCSPLSR